MSNGDSTLLSTVTTTNGEALSAHVSCTRASNISGLEGPESLLMANQNCLPPPSHLEDSSNHTSLIDHNSLTSNQAASFLSYAQEHQVNSIGMGKR